MSLFAVFVRRFSILFYGVIALAGLGALLAAGLFFIALRDLPQVPDPLGRIIETPPTEIFAASGERLMIIGGREVVPLNRISPDFIEAVIATEDHRFWEHHGLDKLRTLKALWITLFEPGKIQGASTITQQLAKNLFFSYRRTYMRKFRELLVALQIETQYSKREILEAYLNQIPFGVGAYGIEQAARSFFGKPALELNLAEAALLAGLPKSPTRYNPYRYLKRAQKRQQVVLARMVAVGYITAEQAQAASQARLQLAPLTAGSPRGSYFLDLVLSDLEERYGPEVVYHGGLKVSTTLDPQQQAWAIESLQSGLLKLDELMGITTTDNFAATHPDTHPQGALVAVECTSGAIKALVGGRDYSETEFNRAVENNRLPGSGFKPFLYYASFEKQKLKPTSVFVDKPITIPVVGAADWRPKNFGREYEGPMILKQALIKSVNAIAAQLVARVGPEAVVDVARRCGITSPLASVYSLSLGTSGVSPLEMAAAFATFATGGVQHKPFWIRRVEDPLGRVLEEHIVRGHRSLDASIGYQVVDMMRDVLTTGTGRVVRRKGFDLPAAGKTGTTDDFRDAWFTGFTPTLSVCVWVGYDRGASMRDVNGVGITGGRGAAPIWADFMIKATSGEPAREFSVPSDIRFAAVDPINGAIAGQWTKNPVKVALRSGQEASAVPVQPTETATGSPVIQMPDEMTIQKGDEPATQTVEKPDVVESADDSTIKEEELPPE
ncbi:MAG: PBP1A family penicillin-binding protein [Desulfobacterales bacterium]|jgi:penicillin-binding protein 1A